MNYSKQILKLFNNRLFQHLSFWLFFILIDTISLQNRIEGDNYFFEVIIIAIRYIAPICVVYLNLLIFIPKFLEKKKYLLYGLAILLSYLIVVFAVNYFFTTFLEDYFSWDNETFKSRFAKSLFAFTFILTIFSSLIHFAKQWVSLKDVEIELNEEKSQRLEAELKTLKAQVNPHFLFNSLNNIYSLSLDKSDLAPEMILKLSELMSYMIYDARAKTISMSKELSFLKSHIELEKIRVQNKVNVEFYSDNDVEQYEIAPLLFTPFIENAFKYVSKNDKYSSFIKIKVEGEPSCILFSCINSTEIEPTTFDHDKHGIGIENVIKRLELIYPSKHELKIEHVKTLFIVNLKIIIYDN